ncbi:hypothetical protein [Viridibacterium curvum]
MTGVCPGDSILDPRGNGLKLLVDEQRNELDLALARSVAAALSMPRAECERMAAAFRLAKA